MKLFYYIDTGHRIGLDRLRRSAPVIKALERNGVDVTMLTNDFRAGEYAKEQFGIKKYVSVDVVKNIANIATPADRVVLDTDSVSRSLLDDMCGYYGKIVRISDDPRISAGRSELLISSPDIVDARYFEQEDHDKGSVYFWGDDDYDRKLLEVSDTFRDLQIGLLEGYYFFMQYSSELEDGFSSIFDTESYDEVLKGAEHFVTSSPQSALEALAAGSQPIYIKRESVPGFLHERLAKYGIPVLESFCKSELKELLEKRISYKTELLDAKKASDVALAISEFTEF